MLTGLEKYSPVMNTPRDLQKKGYITIIRHSNPVVKPMAGCFHVEQDLWLRRKREDLFKKYNRIFHYISKTIPISIYRPLKQLVRGQPRYYLPYARAEQALQHKTDRPQFTWIHLMDSHTPYYPEATETILSEIIKQNDNQIAAVRGYYQPADNETKLWYHLYSSECREMAKVLNQYLKTIDYDETTVIFTSDHGEEFGEHGVYGHHGNRFNPENIEVPFIVVGKDVVEYPSNSHSVLRKYINQLASSK